MDLTPYVSNLRQELAVAADAGGDDARALAERLTAPLESAVRLVLLDALSAAAAEITRDLAPGSVDLRLRGREPSFVVTPPPAEQPFDEPRPRRTSRRRPRRRARRGRRRGSASASPNTSRAGSRRPPPRPGSRSTPGSSARRRPRSSPAAATATAARHNARRSAGSATPAG